MIPKTLLPKDVITSNFLQKVATYIFKERARSDYFIISPEAAELQSEFLKYLKSKKADGKYENSIFALKDKPVEQFQLIRKWLHAFIEQLRIDHYEDYLNETDHSLSLLRQLSETRFKDDATITWPWANALNSATVYVGNSDLPEKWERIKTYLSQLQILSETHFKDDAAIA